MLRIAQSPPRIRWCQYRKRQLATLYTQDQVCTFRVNFSGEFVVIRTGFKTGTGIQMALVPKQRFSDPEEFEAQMAIAVPGLRIRPTRGKLFQVDLSLALLPRVALFSVDSVNLSAQQGETCGVTIPVRGGFGAAVGGAAHHHSFYAGEIYLKPHDRDFNYQAPGSSQVLVANLLSPDLQQKAAVLTGDPNGELSEVVSAASPAGGALTRFAHHFWSELQRPGGLWDCPTALA